MSFKPQNIKFHEFQPSHNFELSAQALMGVRTSLKLITKHPSKPQTNDHMKFHASNAQLNIPASLPQLPTSLKRITKHSNNAKR